MTRTNLLTLLFCLGISSACLSEEIRIPNQRLRNWTDNTGTFRVDATLVSIDVRRQVVKLELRGGEAIEVEFRRLSERDRQRVETVHNQYKKTMVAPPGTIDRLYGIDWYANLPDALLAAAGDESPEDDKPVMCFRALGDLTGFM